MNQLRYCSSTTPWTLFLWPTILALVLVACGDKSDLPQETASDSVAETAKQASGTMGNISKYPGLSLGEGFRPDDPENFDADMCLEIEGHTQVQSIKAFDATGIGSQSRSEFELDADGLLEGGVDIGGVKAEASLTAESYYQQFSNQQLFTLAIRIKTVRVRLNPEGDPDTLCQGDEERCSLYQSCGTHYIHEQIYGGYLYLHIGMESDSQQRMLDLRAELGVSGAGAESAKGQINLAKSIMGSEDVVFVDYSSHGLDSLTPNLSTSSPQTMLDDAFDYLERIECGADMDCNSNDPNQADWGIKEAVANGLIYHDSYGGVLSAKATTYSGAFWEDCGADDYSTLWQCSENFADRANGVRNQYRYWQEMSQDYLDTSSLWDWGAQPQTRQNELQTLVRELDGCVDIIDDALEACHYTMSCNSEEPVCDNCNYDQALSNTGCSSPELFQNRYEDLTGDLRTINGPFMKSIDQGASPAALKDESNYYCWPGFVSGNFAGTGERVLVEPGAGSKWVLDINSNRVAGEEQLRSSAYCVPLTNFTDGTDDLQYSQQYQTLNGSTTMLSDTYVAPLHGFKGEMEGTAEEVGTQDDGTNDHEVYATSNQGIITAYAYSVGTPNPSGGAPDQVMQFSKDIDTGGLSQKSSRTTLLGHRNAGICFMTTVKGDFDGGGESVRLSHDEEHWLLEVSAGCDNYSGVLNLGSKCDDRKNVYTEAECYAYEQF